MTVFGTRPEAIKMMPVVRELRQRPTIESIAATTGQHRDMLDQVFAVFGERPDIDLNLMRPNQTLGQITGAVVAAMEPIFAEHKPDLVLVHGDTTTAMATAMAAFYAKIRIGHVEAGLRSFDLMRPWPEEFNRVTIDAIAELLFAPTETSAANLRREYAAQARIVVTGNTGIDAVLQVAARLATEPGLEAEIAARYAMLSPRRRLVLVTGHRRESFGDGFERICDGLAAIAARPDVELVYPVHLNPNVKTVVNARLQGLANIHLIDPVSYADMIYLMRRAAIILTDSGGIQEEAPALGKPVLVMRDVTERPEALATGVVRLVGTDPARIAAEVFELLDDAGSYAQRARSVFPYGDGTAARQIVNVLETLEHV
jgi:UDP-N-acetylglucosamine 2-epimerase (non-hydrolysing)